MATLIIGDFRAAVLQQYQNKSNSISFNNTYLLENNAEYSWFSTSAPSQLPLRAIDTDSIVIMLGFNDCVYSCTWSLFDINQIADSYVKTINDLIDQYTNLKFYVCSVGPIDADYPMAEYKNGVIPTKVLTEKIQQFNNKIKICKATFIDCYDYLTLTGFNTRDGVRYLPDTSKQLLNYIDSQIITSGGSTFISRLIAPVVNSNDIESDILWLSTTVGGLNPFSVKNNGDTLPNSAAYAWGRFYEILGQEPKLSTGNPAQWYLNTSDGYTRGLAPNLGAIVCWQGSDGHVAIIEQINDDGSIITSESDSSNYWKLTTRTNTDGNWGAGSNYKFQGFIYNPKITASGVVGDYVANNQVISKNAFLTESEMKINARYIWQYLGSRGWSLNAVAGLLGNMQSESTINPGIWQNLREWGDTSGHGYGLVQWTPYTKFTDWCSINDYDIANIDSALKRIEAEVTASDTPGWSDLDQWVATSDYNISFREFTTSNRDAYWLACAFLRNYERPARLDYTGRGNQAQKWYEFLKSYTPAEIIQKPISIKNLKAAKLKPTEVVISFIANNIKAGSYKLITADTKGIEKTFDTTNSSATTEVITFVVDNLTPNTEYQLEVKVVGVIPTDTISDIITFNTPQAFPKVISSIALTALDTGLPNDEFQLKTAFISDWGYWKNTDNFGYDIQLIVNNKVLIEKAEKTLKEIWKFKLSEYFPEYAASLSDTIQIGIHAWVLDNEGNKIFDNTDALTSNSICFLTQPVITYLNI